MIRTITPVIAANAALLLVNPAERRAIDGAGTG